MLDYLTSKKGKKTPAEKTGKEALARVKTPPPLIDEDDERFLERIVSAEGPAPPLPARPAGIGAEAGDFTGNASQVVVHEQDNHHGRKSHERKSHERRRSSDKGKGKDTTADSKKSSRFSFLQRTFTKKDKHPDLKPNSNVPPTEAVSEEEDLSRILDDLSLSAHNNKAFSLSTESQKLVQEFTVILKDLINGVPTAYDDLAHLLDNSQGTLDKQYEKLPSFLQKLITTLPDKLTKNIAPELLAVAAEAQAFNTAGAGASSAGLKGAAKSFLKPSSLKDLVTKPGAVVSMLKAIMNALKLRWPAFMGTNVLLSLGLFVLLFVFWYCHKRGREVRLERERNEKGEPIDSNGRVIELEDDPMLDAPGPSRSHTHSRTTSHDSRRHEHTGSDSPRRREHRPESSGRREQTASDSSRRRDRHREERPESSGRRRSHGSGERKKSDRERERDVEYERRR
ncbi:hypothetical protein LOCC1_G003748 [Lachnellula occidentalis]|uniref:Ring-like domain-containing protein n=1 Tax=Lachnellula occidentalis TaxID=215460 RepID=A0A8H8RWM5_9HELO|nr:hypothetical protein LOCC1_G003748 [Lachnellula occidentalis]